ncbi:Uncharacterized membrane protein YdjX, TVP38/TMEM64 family, SNARE-associated domain [Paenibacillaceae bacterium GAS479]|nr:Uncharacterized membrane protein YdjX, TVP38/TMEM64 family, SNARE-associated domain [Paenibacillaceae bacterium GAS479]
MKYSKWLILMVYIASFLLVLSEQQRILDWIQAEDNNQLFVTFLFAIVFAAVPFVPFGVIGAIVGAKYGLLLGGIVNLTASSIAAAVTYFLFYSLFKQQGLAYLQRSNRLQSLHSMVRENVFWAVFTGRIIPIMPAFLINCYAGVFKLSFPAFLLATVLGKIPAMLVFAYVGDSAASGAKHWITVLLIYILFIGLIYLAYKYVKKTKTLK